MTKTVCDICGCDAKFHCTVPLKVVHDIRDRKNEIKFGEFRTVELTEIDLCDNHAYLLAGFINWLKTAKEGDEFNVL